MIDPNWYRWIAASIADHFKMVTDPLPMFVEGQHRDTDALKDFFELRIVEQNAVELTANDWRVFCDINCLIQSTMDDEDNHRIYRSTGTVVSAYTAIPIFKYGCDPVGDDQSFLGCLQLKQDLARKQLVNVTHFGQVDKECELLHSMVEGMYCIELTT